MEWNKPAPTGDNNATSYAMLSTKQINTLNAVERIGATLSLASIALVFVTFSISPRLRTTPNWFIFFASIANVGACVACLIAYDGIASTRDGEAAWAPLCQAQGFIFEWFMQADPWWSFAMAINVYLVFFQSVNPKVFHEYIWVYCIVCYGLPAIPAFVFLFIHNPNNQPVYGDAVLWCWIASRWNLLRIWSYYFPIWFCSLSSALIYFLVGWKVFSQRNKLKNLSISMQGKEQSSEFTEAQNMNLARFGPGHGYYGTVTTEVQVTTVDISSDPLPAYANPFRDTNPRRTGHYHKPSDSTSLGLTPTASAESPDPLRIFPPATPNTPAKPSPIHAHTYPWSREPSTPSFSPDLESPTATLVNTRTISNSAPFGFSSVGSSSKTPAAGGTSHFESASHSFNAANYTSISAGSSPMTQLRGVSPTRPADRPPPLPARHHLQGLGASQSQTAESSNKKTKTKGATTTKTGEPDVEAAAAGGGGENNGGGQGERRDSDKESKPWPMYDIIRRARLAVLNIGDRYRKMDPVKRAYLRTSFVFAISILVTWTPSSVNRVYTAIYPDSSSWGLNMAAAVVLPLQGVWNAVIYFTTSWRIFCEELEDRQVGPRVRRFLHLPEKPQQNSDDEEDGGDGEEGGGGGEGAPSAAGSGNAASGQGGPAASKAGGSGSGTYASRPSGGSRREMGRGSRLNGGEGGDGPEEEGWELRSPMSSPSMPAPPPPRPAPTPRRSQNAKPAGTVRVLPQALEDFGGGSDHGRKKS